MKSRDWILLSFLLAVVVRMCAMVMAPDPMFPDAQTYEACGKSLISVGRMCSERYMPLYPLLTYMVGGGKGTQLLDIFFSALTCVLIYVLTLEIFGRDARSERAARVAALVWAELLAPWLGVQAENVFVGNGATEIIQAVIHRFTRRKLLINIPTFSAYYEFVQPGAEVAYFELKKEKNFRFDPEEFLATVRREKPDTIVLINPNNPDGSYIPRDEIRMLLQSLPEVENFVVDESFIHFAEEKGDQVVSYYDWVAEFPNLVLIKSMSKDFGVAGLRCGYAVLSPEKRRSLLRTGFLWNSNGLAEYFLRLYVRPDFQSRYTEARARYLRDKGVFEKAISDLPGIRVFPSCANFYLVELLDGIAASDFTSKLLIAHGIYVRNCEDKIGLQGEFVRVAVRSAQENREISDAMANILKN